MATLSVITPIKRRDGIFSTRFAGGRTPLTPSPSSTHHHIDVSTRPESIHRQSSLFSRFARSASKTNVRDSPKSNIAKSSQKSPRRLDLGVSDYALIGTGPASTKATQSRLRVTRCAKTTKTKLSYASADRFVPVRSASIDKDSSKVKSVVSESSSVFASTSNGRFDIDGNIVSEAEQTLSLDGLTLEDDDEDKADRKAYTKPSPKTAAYQASVASACGISLNQRILAFKPAAPESSRPIDLRSQYNRPIKPAAAAGAQFRRRVATAPERVLDAPGLVDDYYLNLLDWSSGNQVAIGLERSVYVWSAESGTVSSLLECDPSTYIASVKWSGDGAYVAAGLGSGEVQIWDVEEGTKLRSMYGHESRVGVMGWNKHVLSTGARSGLVFNHDVRVAEHKIAELVSHTSEVCGLEWRADGAQLATGGNDNLVSIWDARSLNAPKFQKSNHKAAIKALSWCPWQSNLLATGGGSHDRMIHFWNTTSGARVNSIDTGSQVTSLRWSTSYKEIVSSSGFPDNSLSIWSYPTLVKNVEIPAHESRVLHSCLSPDGQMLATAGVFYPCTDQQ